MKSTDRIVIMFWRLMMIFRQQPAAGLKQVQERLRSDGSLFSLNIAECILVLL